MGMNHLGEIAALARIAAPDWGVVTNVGTAHIENFAEGQAGIARAKFELVAALPANGVAFLNCADPYVSQFGRDFPGRVVYFGAGPCADPQIVSAARRCRRPARTAFAPASAKASFTLHLLGAHNASNAMAGLAVALEAGVDLDAAVDALESLTAGDKRGEVLEIGGATILNDSYNSNPEALRSMIRTLAARPAQRRILVAGEMLELGEHAPALHAACGKRRRRGRPRPRRRRARQRRTPRHRRLRRRRRLALSARRRSRRRMARAESSRPATWSSSKARAACISSAPSKSLKTDSRNGVPVIRRKLLLICASVALLLAAPLRRAAIPSGPRPFPPFRIAAISITSAARTSPSYLIVTPQGDILINSNLESSLPQIKKSVESLGFHFSDIKILLISHGALRPLRRQRRDHAR